jgi:hypothetical protein
MKIRRNALHRAVLEIAEELSLHDITVNCDARIVMWGKLSRRIPMGMEKEGCKKILRAYILESKFRQRRKEEIEYQKELQRKSINLFEEFLKK